MFLPTEKALLISMRRLSGCERVIEYLITTDPIVEANTLADAPPPNDTR